MTTSLTNANSGEWVGELQRLGYKGKLLNMLVDAIGNESNLGTFYKFVLDNEGKINSKMSMVSRFVLFMQERQAYHNVDDFANEYISASAVDAKKNVLEKLFGNTINSNILNKVSELLAHNALTLNSLFELVSHYRKSYKPNEIMTLIECKHLAK